MLIAASIIKNEEHRYLKHWLKNVSNYADIHIIVDDGSSDNTINIINQFIDQGYNIKLFTNSNSIFVKQEMLLRSFLWEKVRLFANNGDWIIIVDGDEFYDDYFVSRKNLIMKQLKFEAYVFRLFDMWNDKYYRADGLWSPNKYFKRLFIYKNADFGLTTNGLHNSPLPEYARELSKICFSDIYCIHKSLSRDEDKKTKYQFYIKNVTEPEMLSHARSILEVKPILKRYYINGNRFREFLYFIKFFLKIK